MPEQFFRLQVKIEGAGVVQFDRRQLRAALRQAGLEVAQTARGMIRRTAGAGRFYGRRQAGAIVEYQGSAPGQPPASRTGALASSIRVAVGRGNAVRISAGEIYGRFLETGAVGGGPGRRNIRLRRGGNRLIRATSQRVLQPRPYLSAALEQRRASIEARLRAAIDGGISFKRQQL